MDETHEKPWDQAQSPCNSQLGVFEACESGSFVTASEFSLNPSDSQVTSSGPEVFVNDEVTIIEDLERKDVPDYDIFEDQKIDLQGTLQAFLSWCSVNRLQMSPKVKVMHRGTVHRYGLVASKDIKKGEVLFRVPRKLLLHSDNGTIAEQIEDYDIWLDEEGRSLDETSGWIPLLLTLMYEYRNKDSFWSPYLHLLPKSEDFGHPMFWNEEQRASELAGMNVFCEVQRDLKNIEDEYRQYIVPFLFRYRHIMGSPKKYSLDLYKRMVAFVMSYSFTENRDAPCMVPMADLLNHRSSNNAHLMYEEDHLKMVSLERIEEGCEIFNTFGKLGNAELLQMYGYVEPEANPYDAIDIPVKAFTDVIEEASEGRNVFVQAKLTFMHKWEMAYPTDAFIFDKRGLRHGPDLFTFLRIMHMPIEEFEQLLESHAQAYNDHVCGKLLRQIKLAKKTDTSSGVAIIDIDSDNDEDARDAPDDDSSLRGSQQKRKRGETDTDGSDAKRPCTLNDDPHCLSFPLPSVLSCGHPLVPIFPPHIPMLPDVMSLSSSVVGKSESSAILIDDDSDAEAGETAVNGSIADLGCHSSSRDSSRLPPACVAGSLVDSRASGSSSHAELCQSAPQWPCKEAGADIPTTQVSHLPSQETASKSTDSAVRTSLANETYSANVLDSHSCNAKFHASLEGDSERSTRHCEIPDKLGASVNHSLNTSECESPDSCELVSGKWLKRKWPSEGGVPEVSDGKAAHGENASASPSEIVIDDNDLGTDEDEDLGDADDDDDDDDDDAIEFVGEDIKCQVTYEKLNSSIPQAWKDTIRSILRKILSSMKPDDDQSNLKADEDKFSKEFMARQVRQGQRDIIRVFLAHLT